MNRTFVALLATSTLFLLGTAQAADEAPADQQQSSAEGTDATQDSASEVQAPAEATSSGEAPASNND